MVVAVIDGRIHVYDREHETHFDIHDKECPYAKALLEEFQDLRSMRGKYVFYGRLLTGEEMTPNQFNVIWGYNVNEESFLTPNTLRTLLFTNQLFVHSCEMSMGTNRKNDLIQRGISMIENKTGGNIFCVNPARPSESYWANEEVWVD